MTLQRTGTGTATYRPAGGVGIDAYGLASPSFDYTRRELPPLQFETFPISSSKLGFRFIIYDLRGGQYQGSRMPIAKGHTRAKTSTLDTRAEGEAILPQLTTSASSPSMRGSTRHRLFSTTVFGRLVIGAADSDATNPSLFKETSDTNPALTALTINTGGADLTGLGAVQVDNYGGPFLAVGAVGLAAKLYSDVAASPTLYQTMHADTTDAVGFLQVPLPDLPLLIYGLNGIMYTPASAAYSAAPTITDPTMPWGGWACGLCSLGGAPLAAFWCGPTQGGYQGPNALTGSSVSNDAHKQSRFVVYRTNLRGGDRSALEFPLPWINFAFVLRDGILAGNSDLVYFHNNRGYRYRNLGIFNDVSPNSDRQHSIQGAWKVNDDVFFETNEIASPSGSGNTIRRILKYSWEHGVFQQVSEDETLSTTGRLSLGAAGSLPVSEQTGFLHTYANDAWKRIYQPPAGVNPFSLRQTDGAGAATGVQFAASGVHQMPELVFPSYLSTMRKRITGMGLAGDLDAGGADSYLRVEAGRVQHTFVYGYGGSHQWKDFKESERVNFTHLAPKFTVARGSSAYMTPQILPVVIEGEIDLDRTLPVRVS